jgi:hypothetical protein
MQSNRSGRRTYGTGSVVIRRGSYYGKWRVGDRQVMRKLGPVRKVGTSTGMTKAQAEARLRKLMDGSPRDLVVREGGLWPFERGLRG